MNPDPLTLPETGHDWSEPPPSRPVVVALTLLALLAALAGLAVAVYLLVTR